MFPLRTPDRLYGWFLAGNLAVCGLLAWAVLQDMNREWKPYQRAYIQAERAAAATPAEKDAAARLELGIQQMNLPRLGRVDRCTTCHRAVDNPRYTDGEHPLRYHPNHTQHPFEDFGCTVCHRGQGLATTTAEAHGEAPFWDEPLLPKRFLSASCLACHDTEDLAEEPRLLAGERLFIENGCRVCHSLHGPGGLIGPNLSGVGRRRSIDWMIRHFKAPSEVTPGSSMPTLPFTPEQLDDLTLFLQGQTGEVFDPFYLTRKTLPSPEAGQRLYLRHGCIGCHGLGGLGGDTGPDLTQTPQKKSAKSIAHFLRQPHRLAPGIIMPDYRFSESEIEALVLFITRLEDPGFTEGVVEELREQGKAKP